MISATELKGGVSFLANGKPYQVIKYTLIKMGRGGAVVKVTARNLGNGSIEEKSFSSNASLEGVNTYKKKLQFLYKNSTDCVFMDSKTYEQVEVPLPVLGESAVFLNEGGNVDVLFYSFGGAQDKDDKALLAILPPKVTMKVVECDPGVKGNSATNIYKPAILENGLNIKVPLFIKVGDKIRVDTRTGEYVERAK